MTDYGCWPLDTGTCADAAWTAATSEVKAWATILAVNTLRRLTLNRVGGCPVTVRPCPRVPYSPRRWSSYGEWMQPFQVGGGFANYLACAPGCASTCEVELPGFVGRVDEVKVDGAVIPLTDLRVDDNSILVYQGSDPCPFPGVQNLNLPDTEPGTFSVTYLPAHEVESDGEVAAAMLAVEFAKSCGGAECALPPNIVQIVRQGVVQSFDLGAFPRGVTNIKGVDAFVMTWNPRLLKFAPSVWSPDLPQGRVATWTGS